MARSYSADLRQRVLSTIEGGLSARQAAARFSIGVATAIVWHRRYREVEKQRRDKKGNPEVPSLMLMKVFCLK